jgi:hypothetical protein
MLVPELFNAPAEVLDLTTKVSLVFISLLEISRDALNLRPGSLPGKSSSYLQVAIVVAAFGIQLGICERSLCIARNPVHGRHVIRGLSEVKLELFAEEGGLLAQRPKLGKLGLGTCNLIKERLQIMGWHRISPRPNFLLCWNREVSLGVSTIDNQGWGDPVRGHRVAGDQV